MTLRLREKFIFDFSSDEFYFWMNVFSETDQSETSINET